MTDAIHLGPFLLAAPLGRGGMGEVWAGRHASLDVPVAIKVLDPRHTDPTGLAEAVRTEVEAMAGLSNPHIVTVFDQGRVPHDTPGLPADAPWIAMELAPGQSLTRMHRMTWPGVHAVLEALLDALAHAHARGVVHRDLKPSNVIVHGAGDALEHIKLTDFGIATAARGTADIRTLRGTPRYMAPEQFRRTAREIGPWTDLYALGCLAWSLLTGFPPFLAAEPARVAHQHLYEDAPPFRPRMEVPRGVESWLRRLLDKHPIQRYERAADAAWALAALQEGHELLPASPLPVLADEEPPTDTLIALLDDIVTQVTLPTFVVDPAEEAGPPPARPLDTQVPPTPETWKRPEPPAPPPRILGAALSLYGLRVIPLVGRYSERDQLWRSLREVIATGTPRAVLLQGGSGVGKSALAGWMCERAHEVGAAIVMTATHDAIGGPTHGLGPMVTRELRLVGEPPSRIRREVERLLERHGRPDPEMASAMAAVAAGPEAPERRPLSARERHAAIIEVVRLRSERRPVIVWLDDVHWAPDSVRFVQQLLAQAELPALVLLTAQDEALADRPTVSEQLADLSEEGAIRRLRLGPLSVKHVRRLVRHHLRLSDGLASQVSKRSGGNPLFAVQLLGDWVQRELLVPTERGFALRPDVGAPLPDRLHDMWSDRLARILADAADGSLEALEIAAVLGTVVLTREWHETLGAAGVLPPHGIVGRLVRSRMALPVEDGWRFAHTMLRESIVRGAREAGRWADWNRAAATVLARSDDAETLARTGRHLVDAGEPDRAVPVLVEACRRRLYRDESPAAWPLFDELERALDLAGAPELDPRRAVLQLLTVRALKTRPDLEEATRRALAVEEAARAHGWERLEAEALTEQADIARVRGDLPTAIHAFQKALDRYHALSDTQGMADTLRSLANVAILLGETDHAGALLADAHHRYDAQDDKQGVAMCLAGLGDIARVHARWEEAIDAYRSALTLFRSLGHRSGIALGLHGLAEVNRLTGHLEEAELGYREVVRIDETIGRDATIPRLNLALCLIAHGNFGGAEEELAMLAQAWTAQKRPGYLAIVHIAWLPCCADRDDWAGWSTHAREAAELLEASSLVDPDIARLAEHAGELAHAKRQGQAARFAWEVAHNQWSSMGDDGRAAEMARRLHEPG